ncbi:MAG: HK97 family phage prohead protease [Propionibacteriaceae bacterium]|nr:HK97 family phage prohead protease [Propionibacteriaceae bacterium]
MYTRLVTKVASYQGTDKEGRFTAIVSAFGVLDSQGDIVDPGAFAETVARVKAGEILPVVWSHDYRDPHAIIGEITAMDETDTGLYIEGRLDIDENPTAAQIFQQMKKGRLKEFSIGGEITRWYWDEPKDGPAAFHIAGLDLWEAGPCFKGANPNTELLSIKARLQGEPDPDPATARTVVVKVVADIDADDLQTEQAEPATPTRLTFNQRATHQLQALSLDSQGESMNRKQKRATLIDEAQALVTKSQTDGLTSEEEARFDAITEEVTRLDEQMTAHKALTDKINALGAYEVGGSEQPTAKAATGSLGQRFVGSADFKAFKAAHPHGIAEGTPVNIRARVGKTEEPVAPTGDPVLHREGMGSDKHKPAWTDDLTIPGEFTLLDLITVGTTAESYLPYRQVISRTNNAAVVAEAKGTTGTTAADGYKPISALDTQPAEGKVATYADGMIVTNAEIRDDGAMAALVDATLTENLNSVAQHLLLNGSGEDLEPLGILNTTGVLQQAFATDLPTTLRKAKTKLRGTRTAIQALVLNPEDAEAWDLLKDNTGRFLGLGPHNTGPASAWAVRIVESEAIEPGQGLMGDFKHVHLLLREALSILVFNQHEDFARRNLNYVRGEFTAMQLVRKPSALCLVDLAAG